jgi:hypothetical protein
MIKSALFDQNNNLRSSFKCLITENSNMTKKKQLKDYKQFIDKNELPGYYLSLSDQCRLIFEDNSSFVCDKTSDLDKICESYKIGCYDSARKGCVIGFRALDGTPCGLRKICRFASCKNESDLSMDVSLRNEKYLQHSAYLHQLMCPQGN